MIKGLQSVEDEGLLKVGDALIEHGGIPNYSQQIAIFGQMQEGFAVLDAITDAKTTGEGEQKKPAEDIRITGIDITKVP
jgi:peptidyl-prolyl cis-trans isomerase B (cyclophilin B)